MTFSEYLLLLAFGPILVVCLLWLLYYGLSRYLKHRSQGTEVSDITVEVNGVEQPRSYDENTGTVRLDKTPFPGDEIRIQYTVATASKKGH